MASPGVPRLTVPGGPPSPIPAPLLNWANGQVITVSGTSAQSSTFTAAGGFDDIIEFCSTTNAWIAVGTNPVAAVHTAGSHYIPAGQLRYIYIPAGQLIAVIQDTAGGFASAIPAVVGQ